MSIHSDIDETLRHLGTVQPPSGLEERIHRSLQHAPKSFSMTVVYAVSGGRWRPVWPFRPSSCILGSSIQRRPRIMEQEPLPA